MLMLDRTIVLAAELRLVRLPEKLLAEPDQHRLVAPHSKFDLFAAKRDIAGVSTLLHDAEKATLEGFLVDAQEVGDLFDRAAGTGERLDVFGIDLGLRLAGAVLCESFGHRGVFRATMSGMNRLYCRICWNENGWRYPSGSTSTDAGYAGKMGFGHEEWLFNFSWTADDGCHYAFLQPVSKVREKRAGESLDLVSGPSPLMVNVLKPEGLATVEFLPLKRRSMASMSTREKAGSSKCRRTSKLWKAK